GNFIKDLEQTPGECAVFPESRLRYLHNRNAISRSRNAVPVGLAKAIVDAVISVAAGQAEVKVKRIRGTGVHSKIQEAIECL
ncbi:MAG: hypothetical protein K2O18_14635, partial [Oscillospiraceae bacterium]|nr:hypothetical protein [Oscillospiraceae bacterium]